MCLKGWLIDNQISKAVKIISVVLSIGILFIYLADSLFTTKQIIACTESEAELLCFIWSIALVIAFKDIKLAEGAILAKIIKYLSGISWYVILVHHVLAIIYFTINGVSENLVRDFVIILALSIILAEVVRRITNLIKKLVFK